MEKDEAGREILGNHDQMEDSRIGKAAVKRNRKGWQNTEDEWNSNGWSNIGGWQSGETRYLSKTRVEEKSLAIMTRWKIAE